MNTKPKHRPVVAALVALLMTSCTNLHVTQVDETPQKRIIKLDIRAAAWFSSAQHLTKLKALQTDKTQSFGVDTLGQQGATNVVEVLRLISKIVESLRPTP